MKLFDYVYDGGKNYIQSGEAKRGDYISEMLIRNHIAGFVQPSLRSKNAESVIVYPVTGLVPLTQLVEIKKLSAAGVEALLRSFVRVIHSMDDYLLPIDRLVVEPEHIYQNYGKKSEFLWIYGGEETRGRYIINLFEFLLDKMDERDDRAVNLIYTLYQFGKSIEGLGDGSDQIGTLTMLCKKCEELISAKETPMELKVRELMEKENNASLNWGNSFEGGRRSPYVFEERSEMAFMRKQEPSYQETLMHENDQTLLTQEAFKKKMKKEKKEKIKERKKVDRINVRSMFKMAWDYLNADLSEPKEVEVIAERREDYKLREVKVVKAEDRNDAPPATTLLTNGMINDGVFCLKPEERDEEAVLITAYPFFIGKAEKDIHLTLNDTTVSRYHARIDREDDELWLTDLGSTNGTFLNGMRIIPFERLGIRENDVIVISRKKYRFCYMR